MRDPDRDEMGRKTEPPKPKPRVAQVMLRLPWLYREGGGRGITPGEQGLVTEPQLRLMMRRVKKAEREGVISAEAAKLERGQLRHGVRVIESSIHDDVGVWCPADKVIRPRARKR